jgi:hypothetical protein
VRSDRINGIEQNSGREFDLAGKVIGLATKVHRTLGPGFLESVYKKALHHELHEVQLVNYLTATGKDVGLLLNFGARSLEFKKKFRVYREAASEPFRFRENFVNSVNSV